MKNKDINNKPALIFLFAVLFLGGGLAGIIGFWNKDVEDKTFLLGVCAVFVVVGLYLTIYGIIRAVKLSTVKKLKDDPTAFVTDATFIKANFSSYSSSSISSGSVTVPTSINVFMKITYEYVDEMGEKHVVKSTSSYYPKQIEYLQQKGTFKIKCRGKYSEIIEEIPEVNSKFNIV